MKKALVIAGTILVDVIKTVSAYPDAGRLAQILSAEKSVGGAVPNTALDLAALDSDFPVRVFGRVGNDEYGMYVTEKMRSAGLDTSPLLVSEKAPTSFTDVMSVPGGERTFFTMQGANAELDVDDFDFSRLNASHFHLAYLLLLGALDKPDSEYGSRAARVLSNAQKTGATTSLDLVSEQGNRYESVVIPALRYTDYLIINEVEASFITGIPLATGGALTDCLKMLATRLIKLGVRQKVVIHCPTTGVCVDRDGNFSEFRSIAVPKNYIIGKTGAGDAFCAAALYGILHGYPDREMLSLAACAAAANLSAADSVSGMRSLSEVKKLGQIYGTNK